MFLTKSRPRVLEHQLILHSFIVAVNSGLLNRQHKERPRTPPLNPHLRFNLYVTDVLSLPSENLIHIRPRPLPPHLLQTILQPILILIGLNHDPSVNGLH